jgi:hypothetical protein
MTNIEPRETNDSLAKAISYLNAQEVAPGRYAIPSKSGKAWFTTNTDGVIAAADESDVRLSVHRYQKMPAWWTPEQTFAYRLNSYGESSYGPWTDAAKAKRGATIDDLASQLKAFIDAKNCDRITADLNTGEEIPA